MFEKLSNTTTTSIDADNQLGAQAETQPTRIRSDWPRRGGIRLKPAKDGQRDVVYPENFLRSVLDSQNGINRLELLSMPGEDHQENVIIPGGPQAVAPEEPVQTPEQTKLSSLQTKTSAERDRKDPLTGALTAEFERSALSETYGYDLCDVDFDPIEQAIRPTCRLVVAKSPDLYPLARKRPRPVAEMIDFLNRQDIPYILQTIISKGGSADYEVSQRLALYPPDYGIALEGDFAEFIEDGPPVDLSDYYDPGVGAIRSNFDLDGHDFFRIDGTGPEATVEARSERNEATARRARRILQGKQECNKLYHGYHETDQDLKSLYRNREFFSKIPVNGSELGGFVAFVLEPIEYSPWDKIRDDKPKLITRRGEAPPSETTTRPARDSHHPTEGGESHRLDIGTVAEYHEHRGYTVHRIDEESSGSVPDLIVEKDGQPYFIEVEDSGTTRAANVLTNAARAAYYDVPVYIYVKDKSRARRVASWLRQPVKATTETGAQLYTKSNGMRLEGGGKPLLPPDAEPHSQWYLVNDDPDERPRLELRANGRVLASGPIDESVKTWEYDTDVIPSDQEVPDGRTQVHDKFLPTKLAYLQNATIKYKIQEGEFATYAPEDYEANWDIPDNQGVRKRYKNAFGKFLKNKTLRLEGAELLRDEVIETCLEGWYKPQTTRKAPDPGEAGRALWYHIKNENQKENNPEDVPGKLQKIDNRTWRWPRDVLSPDLPFVGDGDPVEPYLE